MLGLAFTGRSGLGAGPAESVSPEKLRKKDSQTDHKQDTGDYDAVGLNRQGKHLTLQRNMSIRIGFGTKRQFPLFVLKGLFISIILALANGLLCVCSTSEEMRRACAN